MKQLLLICALLIAFTSCVDTPKPQTAIQQPDEENPPMLVAFGTVGDGTSMHSLELINQKGDTLYFVYENNAVGGLAVGDSVNVEFRSQAKGLTSTTCLGTSLAAIYSSSWKTVPTNML